MADNKGTDALKKEKVGTDEKKKQDQDLTDILDLRQRIQVTLLIANITETMRQNILNNFDATATLNKSLLDDSAANEQDRFANADFDPGTVDVEQYDREKKLKETRDKEISTHAMKQLKTSALKAYDEWREEVIQRVGEVVNDRKTAQKQKQEAQESESKDLRPAPSRKLSALGNEKITSLHELFPPVKTPLLKLDSEKRILILHSLLLLLLSLEHYNAYSRVLLLYIASSLHLSVETLSTDEAKVAKGLMEAAKEMTGDEEIQKKAEANKDSRKWKVGLASVAGAAVVGITGGLAAPLVAAGIGSVMGGLGLGATAAAGYLGSVAGSTVVVGSLFGAYGGRMTGQMMDNFAREVEDFKFLPVHGPEKSIENASSAAPEDRRLKVTVGISGWLTEKDEVVKPWRVIGTGAEVFALRWELEALMNLGNSMNELVTSAAFGYAQSEIIKRTIFADLMGAMWPIGLLKVARLVDNPFSVAKSRAEKAGEVLADAIIHKAQGERPLTMIGYSLGARVIYACLMSLAKRKAFGLVESVVLMGAPLPSDTREWRIMRTVVSGRLVNVYSENDYVLGFLYRTSSIQYGIAGLQNIEGIPGVENVDVSETISGHMRYRYLVGNILKKIGFEDIDMEEVEREEEALKKMEEEEKKKSLLRQSIYKKSDGEAGVETDTKETDDLEKEVKAKTDQSMMEWAYEQLTMAGISRAVGHTTDPSKSGDTAAAGLDTVQATAADVSSGDVDQQNLHMTYMQRAYAHLPGFGFGSTGVNEKAAVEGKTDVAGGADVKDKTEEVEDAPQMGSTSYLQRAYASLPRMPQVRGGGTPEKTPEKPKANQQGYLSYASSYIPTMGFGSKAPATDSILKTDAPKVQQPEAPKTDAPDTAKVEAPKFDEPKAPKVEEVGAPKGEELNLPKIDEWEAAKAEEQEGPKDEVSKATQVEEPEASKKEQPNKSRADKEKAPNVGEQDVLKAEEQAAPKTEKRKPPKLGPSKAKLEQMKAQQAK